MIVYLQHPGLGCTSILISEKLCYISHDLLVGTHDMHWACALRLCTWACVLHVWVCALHVWACILCAQYVLVGKKCLYCAGCKKSAHPYCPGFLMLLLLLQGFQAVAQSCGGSPMVHLFNLPMSLTTCTHRSMIISEIYNE
jgi:hypothetical protein